MAPLQAGAALTGALVAKLGSRRALERARERIGKGPLYVAMDRLAQANEQNTHTAMLSFCHPPLIAILCPSPCVAQPPFVTPPL